MTVMTSSFLDEEGLTGHRHSQGHSGLQGHAKVKLGSRKVGIKVTEDEFTRGGWAHRTSESEKQRPEDRDHSVREAQ